MKKILPITFVLILLSVPAISSKNPRGFKRDSLRAIISNMNLPDTTRIHNGCYLVTTYDYKDPDSMLYYARIFNERSVKANYLYGIVYTKVAEGWYYVQTGKNKEALKCYLAALKPAAESGRASMLGFVYGELGTGYGAVGLIDKACEYQLKAIKIFRDLKDPSRELNMTYNLGENYTRSGNLKKAIEIRLRVIAMVDSLKLMDDLKSGALDALGSLYRQTGRPVDAVKAYNEAFILHKKAKNLFFQRITALNLGRFFLDDTLNIYGKVIGDNRKSADISLAYLQESENLARTMNDMDILAQCYALIGKVFLLKGEKKRALDQIAEAQKLDLKNLDPESKIGYTQALADIYTKLHEDAKAVEQYKKLINLTDSLDRVKMAEKVSLLTESFEIEQMEGQLAQKEHQLTTNRYITWLFISISVLIFILALIIFYFLRQKQKAAKLLEEKNKVIEKERDRSESLLLNILPYEVSEELKQTGHCIAKTFSMVTVMFADFKDFTSVSEKISAELLVDEINSCFSAFDLILPKYKVEKIKTVGDSYICVSGLPVLSHTHAFDMVNAAIEIRNFMLTRKQEKEARGEIPFELRIGIHTGPVVAGIVGIKKFQYDIWGDTVNLAARMEQSGEAGQVNISGVTYALVKNQFNFTPRGKIVAKNKGEIDMYFVTNRSESLPV